MMRKSLLLIVLSLLLGTSSYAQLSSSSLPLVVINTNNGVAPAQGGGVVYGRMGIIWNGVGQTNHISDPYNNYNGYISMKVHGSSSAQFDQKAYNVETEDAAGNNNNVSLVGLPSDNDWILYAPYDDKSLIRNVITYAMANAMGDYAPRTRFCEVVLNGDYRGVYVLMEKIKQGSDRVDIKKMKTTDTAIADVTGGYILQVDRDAGAGVGSWTSNYASCNGTDVHFVYVYPKSDDINIQQKQYIATYINQFETALKNNSVYDTVNGYRKYIDVPSFIDFSLQQEMGHNVDAYRLSSFLHKDKNGKLMGGPIWDFNEAYGNADYYDGSDYSTFEWAECVGGDPDEIPFWWQQFQTDTNYVKDLKCRYTQLRQTVFDTTSMYHMIDSLVGVLQVPQQRHFARWNILGQYVWPNAYVGATWQDEITYLKGWLGHRVQWMDSTLLDTSCKMPVDTTVTTDTGTIVRNVNLLQTINAYPNPASDELHVVSGITINHISMYNMIGQLVYDNSIKARSCTISLKQYKLSSGIYNMTISTGQDIVRKKIVINSR